MTDRQALFPDGIPPEKFSLADTKKRLRDRSPETPARGYWADAIYRFTRNGSSVAAAFIILLLMLYAILVPLFFENDYTRSLKDTLALSYAKLPPKAAIPVPFFDGCSDITVNAAGYAALRAIAEETGEAPIVQIYAANREDASGSKKTRYYDLRIDAYAAMGMMLLTLTPEQ